jgi:hypothetical protein
MGSQTIFSGGSKTPLAMDRDMFIKMEEIISSYKNLLNKYLAASQDGESSKELELEVLYACQEYWVESQNAKQCKALFSILISYCFGAYSFFCI